MAHPALGDVGPRLPESALRGGVRFRGMAGGLDHRPPCPTAGSPAPPPLGQMARLIVGFGGFLGRKHDSHPGPKGMQKVRAFAIALEAGRAVYAGDQSCG